jgi:hypothetical protein
VVSTTADDGLGSLRQAIVAANAHPGRDTINFDIASSGVQTINLLSPLPDVTDSTVINATTESGYAGTPLVVLNGSQAGATDGLVIDGGPSGGSSVRGLCINQFQGDGLLLQGNSNDVVEGCFLGTDATGTVAMGNHGSGLVLFNSGDTIGGSRAIDRNLTSGNLASGIVIDGGVAGEGTGSTNVVRDNEIGTDLHGTAALGNGADGVLILNGAANNRIGMPNAGAGNLISGNVGRGIEIDSPQNLVQGNLIGTDVSGNLPLGNTDQGVLLASDRNKVGGTAPGDRNVIANNSFNGIYIAGSKNLVQGNLIGTNAAGAAMGNGLDGVAIVDASKNTIGGTVPGAGNTIDFNGQDGVLVVKGGSNDIQENSISANADLGIDLQHGANRRQAAPVLTSAVTTGSSITIKGRIKGSANSTFTVEFFANPTSGPSGQTFLGSATVTTGSTGSARFTVPLNATVAPGQFITATATDSVNDTSRFSKAIQATSATAATLSTPGSGPLDVGDLIILPLDKKAALWPGFEFGGLDLS